MISTEEVKFKGTGSNYPIDFTRDVPLKDLSPGTYTLSLTNAIKRGGYSFGSNVTTFTVKDHIVTFTVGG
ncbi:hypothetical protein [Streptomyces sp. TLI_146]|uniref:hypothetical protein n=1 Tax=Streptomyces sp. TLI_146 TaxID=1938858 RepID=UPI000CB25D9E|nr:hypothetical protein [Streptomyces sp. TLI_146]PKV82818.1 hypothetical protein BX283_0279 [Streptomyces sp. TLI_146]